MPVLFRDYETRSSIDIRRSGAWRYATDATSDVWCCSYCVDDGPVKLWVPPDPVPREFVEASRNPDWIVAAFNDAFERLIEQHIMAPRYGWLTIPLERHRCLQASALASALPASLESVAEVLKLEHQKDKAGAANMRAMAKPRAPRQGEDPALVHWRDEGDRLERLYAYCREDVEIERELHGCIGFLSVEEQALWQLDAAINDRGIHIDGEPLDAAIRIAGAAQTEINAELIRLTAGEITTVGQTERIIAWLTARECPVNNLQKGTLRKALTRKALPPEARRVIELRLSGAHAAAAKLNTMRAWRNGDGRARGVFRFHGASTGRWTSFGIQLQNLKRPQVDNLNAAIAAVATGDINQVRKLHPQPLSLIGDITRAMIVAPPGHRLIIGDFSGVESRVTAWVSGQQSKLDQWAAFDRSQAPADDPYFKLGRSLGFVECQARELGKVADLAFGYQGGAGAWQKLAPADDQSTEQQIKARQQAWRRAHPKTVQFWNGVNRASIWAMQRSGQTIECSRVAFTYDGREFLRLRLPSGRLLTYPFPRLATGNFGDSTVVFMDSQQGRWTECRHGHGAYGGLWTENIVQAVARDLFACAMQRLEAAGYPIVLHVHDEIVAEVRDGFGNVEEFRQLLTTVPPWAEGLPVAAKVRNGPRFANSERPSETLKNFAASDAARAGEPCSDTTNEAPEPTAEVEDEIPPHVDEHAKSNGHYANGEREWGRHIGSYIYRDASGHPYLKIVRTSAKQFPQFHWNDGRWHPGKPSGPKIPYQLPELIAAAPSTPVFICEGEKDAESVAALGLVATTNSEGAGKWTADLNRWFSGKRTAYIVEDNDDAGRKHATQVANALHGIVPDVRIISFLELPEHGDVSDWLAAGHTKEELIARAQAAAPAVPDLDEWDAGELLNSGLPEPRQWLMSRQFCRGFLSGLVAPGDVGKTTLRLTQAIELATDRDLLGHRIYQRCRVLVLTFEDDSKELHRRLAAICQHHQIDPVELKGWLFCRDLNGAKLVEFNKGERQLGKLDTMLRRAIERRHPDLIILDPFVKLHSLDENSNSDMDFVCSQLIQIAHDYNIAIDSPAHTRKGPAAAGDADLRRGASAQRDAGRLDYTLTPMSEEEAERFDIDVEERKGYVRLDRAKANIVRAIKAEWYRLVSVPLGNATELYPEGDEVQAIEPWSPPEVWAGVTIEVTNAILNEIDAGLPNGRRYSDHNRVAERSVWPVMQKYCPGKSEAACREILRGWFKSKFVFRDGYEDPVSRKKVKGLYVNSKREEMK